jgi:regulator of PEP synthase PpsR (kinase-PPPase family)
MSTEKNPTHTVYFVSDRTGITIEVLGNSLLTQFEGVDFKRISIPFLKNEKDLEAAILQINTDAKEHTQKPVVFLSLVNDEMNYEFRARVKDVLILDFFQSFLSPLEKTLGIPSAHAAGRSHSVVNADDYFRRMEAINFSQMHDDGATTRDLSQAEIILVGVSRCGKTPTSLFMAMQYGIRAANYPLTPDDFADRRLPETIRPLKDKLFGLTIDPMRLSQIRGERRPDSHYASLENCKKEVHAALALMQHENIPYLDTTAKSIEEIAAKINFKSNLRRHVY